MGIFDKFKKKNYLKRTDLINSVDDNKICTKSMNLIEIKELLEEKEKIIVTYATDNMLKSKPTLSQAHRVRSVMIVNRMIEDIKVYGVKTLKEVVEHINDFNILEPVKIKPFTTFEVPSYLPDFKDVKGQFEVKRALEVAAAGGGHTLIINALHKHDQLVRRVNVLNIHHDSPLLY